LSIESSEEEEKEKEKPVTKGRRIITKHK
jgi:hypothetical protein